MFQDKPCSRAKSLIEYSSLAESAKPGDGEVVNEDGSCNECSFGSGHQVQDLV